MGVAGSDVVGAVEFKQDVFVVIDKAGHSGTNVRDLLLCILFFAKPSGPRCCNAAKVVGHQDLKRIT